MAEMLPIIGTVLSVGGNISAGNAQDKAATFQASQLEQQAGQERAAAQRRAIEDRRQAQLAQSRLLALSGGSSTDATIVGLSADIAEEGEYRALSSLYEGEERARGDEMRAKALRYEGKQAKKASKIKAVSSLLSGGSSLFDKYG